jgi:hypothetical protein
VTPVRAGVAMPLVEGLRNPTVARDDDINDWFRSISHRSRTRRGRRFMVSASDESSRARWDISVEPAGARPV